jgi:hypothetical protein
MIKKSTLSTITNAFSALGINAVPAAGFFGLGWGWETTMLLYLIENLVGIILVALRIRLLAPAQEEVVGMSLPPAQPVQGKKAGQKVQRYAWPTANGVLYNRNELLKSFLLITGGFSVVTGVFIATLLFLMMKVTPDPDALRSGLVGMLSFQLVALLSDVAWRRPLSLVYAEKLSEQSMGRVALLYLAVFAGVCAAPFHSYGFVLPFIGLKTMVDVGQPIQALLERRKPVEATAN